MVNLLYDISYGDILFGGRSIKTIDLIEHRRSIGYVVQQSGLFPHMSVEKNISLIPNLLKWDKQKTSERVEELLKLVDLDPKIYKNRFPRQLSGGQQQRVGIARALASNPDVMLMDEPFGAIDNITRESLQNELLRIQKTTKKTILFVTHDIREAIKLGDRILVMDNGCVQQFDTPNEIILNPANEFVRKLISSDDDKTYKLQLLTVDIIVDPVDGSKVDRKNSIELNANSNIQQIVPYLLKDRDAKIYIEQGGIIVGLVNNNKFNELIQNL